MHRRHFLFGGAAVVGSLGSILPGAERRPRGTQGREAETGERIRLAAFQGTCVDDIEVNLEKALQIVDSCGRKRTDFLCFPEGYLSNYSRELAVRLSDPRLQKLAEACRAFDMVTVVGVSELEGDKVYNTALVFDKGRLLGTYRKTMLTESDREIFAPDYTLPTFRAKGIHFGVIICHDSSFVEPALTMRCRGARLLFSPHYNSIDTPRMDEHRRKVRNTHIGLSGLLQMVVVRSNVVGSREGELGYGDTSIFSPLGEVVAAAPLFQETVVSADFDRSVFEKEKWACRAELPTEVIEQLCAAERASGG